MKKLILLLAVTAIILCSCSVKSIAPTSHGDETSESAGETSDSGANAPETVSVSQEFSQDTIDDGVIDGEYDCRITFDSSVTVSGTGATADGNTVTISKAGVYAVSGSCDDCRISVNVSKDEQVEIALYNANLSSKDGPVIEGLSSDRIKVIVPEGSVSTLTDASSYTYGGEANACIWSKDDLTVKGNGSLTVVGNYNNGISSTNDIKIICASLTVTAADNAVRGKDSVSVESGSVVTIKAGGAGIKSSEEEDAEKGYIALNGGIINITSSEDGIHATNLVTVGNCVLNITSGNGSSKSYNDTVSRKGIKSGGDLQILSGTTVIDSIDDSLHCAGTLTVAGGDTTLSSGDDGVHSDGNVYVTGGKLDITKSYEGLEGQNVYISGGEISIVSSDDGINAAGGSDTQGGMRQGFNPFGGGSNAGDYHLVISGGITYVNASGDGVDSNGDITVSGGILLVSGPTDNGNGALDYESGMVITGGIVVAAGSSGMAENATTGTTQCSVMVSTSKTVAGGSKFSISGDDGVIYEFTPAKAYSNVVISHPDIEVGKSYTVTMGTETQTVTVTDTVTGNGSGMGGGGGGQQGGPGGQQGGPGGNPWGRH